jgi:hypothetical protein
MRKMSGMRVRADFNGLFGNLLCLSHGDSCKDESGAEVVLRAGMELTAFDEDVNERGERDDLIASGTVKASPEWLACKGSRWVLEIDAEGVKHESELKTNPPVSTNPVRGGRAIKERARAHKEPEPSMYSDDRTVSAAYPALPLVAHLVGAWRVASDWIACGRIGVEQKTYLLQGIVRALAK